MNLENPAWLWVWIVVPAIAISAVLAGRLRPQRWEKLAAERLHGKLIRRNHPLPRWLSLSLLLAGIGALALTMSRPQGDAGTKTEMTEGRNVMVALDLSRSMRVQDVKPDRLAQAKIVIYELLETLESDRVGLVGFAGKPFLYAPLTIDHVAVKETVEQIDEEWVTEGGSDISAAIQLATKTLKETGQKNNALVLISDGEELEGDLDAIVKDAERAGVTIFAIGVGTEDGGFVPHPGFTNGMVDREGNRILSRLQPDVLRKLAKDTGGTYVIAGKGADIPSMVEVAIQGMDSFEMDGGQTRIVIEFFQWILLPAILFLMACIVAGTRWRGISNGATAMLLIMFVMNQNASADRVKDAKDLFSEERYGEARDMYRSLANGKSGEASAARFRLGEGLAAYEARDYRGARSAYSAALMSDSRRIVGKAHEGIGNTLFQLGWVGLSGSRYPNGEEQPDMEKFDGLVRGQLAKMAEADVPESGETNEFIRLDSIILNWTDAVRHYQSAIAGNPGDEAPVNNMGLTVRYLKRLQELLEEEKDRAEQEMPQSGEGEGPPQEGEGEGEGKGSNGEGKGGNREKQDDEGAGDEDGEKEKDGDMGEEPDGKKGEGEDPDETPDERARRLLSENQDLEKGPSAPGRREFRDPEKDY